MGDLNLKRDSNGEFYIGQYQEEKVALLVNPDRPFKA